MIDELRNFSDDELDELADNYSEHYKVIYEVILITIGLGSLAAAIISVVIGLICLITGHGNNFIGAGVATGILQAFAVCPIITQLDTFRESHYSSNQRTRFERDFIKGIIPMKYKI